jgi:adenylate kinase
VAPLGEDKNVVLITGPPNNGRDECITQILPHINKKKETGYYHVFEYMQKISSKFGIANLTRENVFDITKEKLDEIRNAAFAEVIKEIQETKNEIDIVSTPAVFRVPYRGTYFTGEVEGLNIEILNELNPKLIVIFIDDLLRVKNRVTNDQLRKEMNFNLKDLAEWRESAIQIVKSYAESMIDKDIHVDYVIFAKEHPANTLEDLILKEKPRIYLSYHITGQEGFEDVNNLISKLEKSFICLAFDSAIENNKKEVTVESNYSDGTKIELKIPLEEAETAIDLIRSQIVERDLDIIANVHATVVYHKGQEPSYGVMVEVFHSAVVVQKPVYVLYPYKIRPSPFFEHYIKRRNLIQGTGNIEEMQNALVAKLEEEYTTWLTWPNK